MVAWESNPTLGALIADLGPYTGTDSPVGWPPLLGRFPTGAGEIDYYVFDPATENYLTMGSTPAGPYSNSYIYRRFDGTLRHGAYNDNGAGDPLPAGSHLYIVWYDAAYSSVPAAPSVSPEAITLASYAATGALSAPVFHWGPWLTPPPQTFTFAPAAGSGSGYSWTASEVSIADSIATPYEEVHGNAGDAYWVRSEPGPSAFVYTAGSVDISLGLTQYAVENGTPGFRNYTPALPADAVTLQQETAWDHTHYTDMLASIVGDITFDIHLRDYLDTSVIPEDVTITAWVEPSSGLSNYDTTYGQVQRIAGVPTQADLSAHDAVALASVAFPVGSSPVTMTTGAPRSALYDGMLPYRADEAPSLRISYAIHEGIVGLDPVPPDPGSTTGRILRYGGGSVTVTYTPPRYRFQYAGGDLVSTVPPLRHFPRADGARQFPRTPTSDLRQGPAAIR